MNGGINAFGPPFMLPKIVGDLPDARREMKTGLLISGVVAAVAAGGLALVTLGTLPALIVVGGAIAAVVSGFAGSRPRARLILSGLVITAFAAFAILGLGAAQLLAAIRTTDGPVTSPDAGILASADAKIGAVAGAAAFRLELTGPEMTAYVLDALQDKKNNPLKSVQLVVIDGTAGAPGRIGFNAEFKGGGSEAEGEIAATVKSGRIAVELVDLSFGMFQVPGLAEGAIEDLIEEVSNLNQTLAAAGAQVQSIAIGDGKVTITGTQRSTDVITAQALLAGLAANAASLSAAVDPPPERAGPGRINDPVGTVTGNPPFVVALGDSLAANVGVVRPRDGYVSRFHNQLEQLDGTTYGLVNFGIPGETSGTLINGGQLEAAISFIDRRDVAYVTIDIGANNLLGHLGSEDCSESLETAACRQRLAGSFATYREDMDLIMSELVEAAPDATVILLTAYNPFSLGFSDSVGLEAESDEFLREFNEVGSDVARTHGALIADGFGPMQGTTAATTHMLASPPDIHPKAIGYDILACALVEAVGASC